MTIGSKLAWDDTVLPFQLDLSDIRGRVARLDGVLNGILSQHDYPAPVEALVAEHPVPFEDGRPTKDDQYNTSHNFQVRCQFPNGVEMNIVSKSKDGNGILFEGSKGRFFVS